MKFMSEGSVFGEFCSKGSSKWLFSLQIAATMEGMQLDNLESICEVLFKTAAEGLIVADRSGHILIVNPKACSLFGYSLEEFRNLSI